MKTQNKPVFIFSLAAICCLNSCIKEGGKGPGECRLSNITTSNGGQPAFYKLTYNNDGRVSNIAVTGSFDLNKVFTYSGNMVLVTNTAVNNNDTSIWVDSIVFDARNRPVLIRQYDPARTSWNDNRYIYIGDELVRSEQSSNTELTPEVSTWFYNGKNLTRLETPHATYLFEYYLDEEKQLGDFLDVGFFLSFGVVLYPHVNLVKSQTDNSGRVTNYTYEKNNDGQITRCTSTRGTDIATLIYQYECD